MEPGKTIEGGVTELQNVLSLAVIQLHQFCQGSLAKAGKIGLEGSVTLKTDTTASVTFDTHELGLRIVAGIGIPAPIKEDAAKKLPTLQPKPLPPRKILPKRRTRGAFKMTQYFGNVAEGDIKWTKSQTEIKPVEKKDPRARRGKRRESPDKFGRFPSRGPGRPPGKRKKIQIQALNEDGTERETKEIPIPRKKSMPSKSVVDSKSDQKGAETGDADQPEKSVFDSAAALAAMEAASSSGSSGVAAVPISDALVQLIKLPVSKIKSEPTVTQGKGLTEQDFTGGGDEAEMVEEVQSEDNTDVVKSELVYAPKDMIGKFKVIAIDTTNQVTKSKRIVRCDLCKTNFKGMVALREHIDTTHAVFISTSTGRMEKRYACDSCDKTYALFTSVKYHKMSHTGEVPHLCNECGKGFVRVSGLNQHMLLYHSNNGMKCRQCHRAFDNERDYKIHVTKVHIDQEIVCKDCGKVFTNKARLKKHVTYSHLKTEDCPHCGLQVSSTYLKTHLKIHLGIKTHRCQECGKRFSTATGLKNHANVHSDERRYKCTICGVQFDLPCRAKDHARIHTGEKPYVCDICGESFTKMGTLTRHKLYHTGEKPHACTVCGKGYTNRSKCLQHMRRHHPDIKPFMCIICQEKFFTKHALEEHSIIHVDQPLLVNNHSITIHDDSNLEVAISSINADSQIIHTDATALAQEIEIPS